MDAASDFGHERLRLYLVVLPHHLDSRDLVHINADYARSILEKAYQDLNTASQRSGQGPLQRPWLQAPYQADCLQCHYGIEYQTGPAFGRSFPHQTHVVSAKIRCTICHGKRQTAHGTLRLQSEQDCNSCHSQLAAIPKGEDCLKCHILEDLSNKVHFPHKEHANFGLACSVCHQGVEKMAHRDFAQSGAAIPKLGHEFCGECHSNDLPLRGKDCKKCHNRF